MDLFYRLGEMKTAIIPDGDARISNEVDLGSSFGHILVIVPALNTSSVVNIQVAEAENGTFVTLWDLQLETPANIACPVERASVVKIGGARYIKVSCANDQTGDKTIYVVGN